MRDKGVESGQRGWKIGGIVEQIMSPGSITVEQSGTGKPSSTKMINAIALLLTLAIMMPWSAPVLAVQLSTCELPDGDVDGDECITQNVSKNNGGENPDCNHCPKVAGNPINIATGNKFENEVDYISGGPSPLLIRRYYNSSDTGVSSFGVGWRGTYSRAIMNVMATTLDAMRDDGKVLTFTLSGTLWTGTGDINSKLVQLATGWQYTTGLDEIEIYNANGQLVSITDRAGLTQNLSYDAQGHLISVTDLFGRSLIFAYTGTNVTSVTVPSGATYLYSYDANNNLSTVTYPDNAVRTFVYENLSFPHALTGIVDETGQRFSTYTYDALGRAISTEHASGVNKYTLDYNYLTYGYVPVEDALGITRTSTFTNINDVALETLMNRSCPSCPASYATTKATTTYDANGNITSQTGFNGNQTTYSYDLTRNLETSRTEGLTATGATTPQTRTITTQWHPAFRLPTKITAPSLVSTYSYDSKGSVTQKSLTDLVTNKTQNWNATYTYSASGILLKKVEDGPRTDVSDLTTYDYYPEDAVCSDGSSGCRGQLKRVTSALGHITQITGYTPNGQPAVIVDPNGLTLTLTYDMRHRLKSLDASGELTIYNYDPAGQMTRVIQPNGAYLAYTYDSAHRLIGIKDQLGNTRTYTLDNMGNRIKDELFDPNGQLARSQTQVYDALSRLQTLVLPQ